MALLVIILSVAVPLCLVAALIGCLNCFMKKKPGFSTFSNTSLAEQETRGHRNDAFTVDMESGVGGGNESHIEIEPLPDILSNANFLPPLRPKILSVKKDNEDAVLTFLSSHQPFPRQNLTYLNPLGTGWFGQAIMTEALRISAGSLKSQTVVKILKDEATKVEEKQFIEEILAFRSLDHPNVMSLLGQCTETSPFLVILEYASHGDLKSFLEAHKQNMDVFLKKDKLLHFGLNAAAGVACMHQHGFVHCDLAARNCLVMSDYTVKIGDYGLGEHLYKDDYLQTSADLLPVRWMAPESLLMEEGKPLSAQNFNKATDMWSFGVLLWEIFSFAERPYKMLTDEAVIQGVVLDRVVSLSEIPHRVPFHSSLTALIAECCKNTPDRASIESVHQTLEDLARGKVERVSDDEMDFDRKWNHLVPHSQSRSQSMISEDGLSVGAIGLAGSFSSQTPMNQEERLSSAAAQEPHLDAGLFAPEKNVPSALSSPSTSAVPIVEELDDKNDSLTSYATPTKVSAAMSQMTTSTPREDKIQQNKLSAPLDLTPQTAATSSQPIATSIQDTTSVGENSLLGSSDISQMSSKQEFKSFSSENDSTPQGLVEDRLEALDTSSPALTEENKSFASEGLSFNKEDIFSIKEDEIIEDRVFLKSAHGKEDVLQSEKTISTNFPESEIKSSVDSVAGVSVVENTPVISAAVAEKPLELDTSFDILVPSMISPSQQSDAYSPISILDPLEEGNENVIPASAETNTPQASGSLFPTVNEVETPQDNSLAALDVAEDVKTLVKSDNSLLETDLSSSSNFQPSKNPFFNDDVTITSSSNDAVLQNKSDIDASSSLNSSLIGWDTSIPESDSFQPAATKTDQPNSQDDFMFVNTAESVDNTSCKSSPLSSDYSFVETPTTSTSQTNLVDDGNLSNSQSTHSALDTNTESLLSAFGANTVSTESGFESVPSLSAAVSTDPFGLGSTASAVSHDATTSLSSNFQPTSTSHNLLDGTFDFPGGFSTSAEPNEPDQGSLLSSDLLTAEENSTDNRHNQAATSLSSSDLFSGFDPFSNNSAAISSEASPSPQDLEVLTSAVSPGIQVGTRVKGDFGPVASGDESGVHCHSYVVTENSSAITAIVSDSCYASVVESKSSDNTSTSEDVSSKEFSYVCSMNGAEIESDMTDRCDSEEDEIERRNSIKERLMGEELFLKLQEHQDLKKTSPSHSDCNDSDDQSSGSGGKSSDSDSDSEREYVCVNPFDTGQPPTSGDDEDVDKENLNPCSFVDPNMLKSVPFEDLNEQELKFVSEIYLSKGVTSPHVFQVPTLETIPEHSPLQFSMSGEANPTPSETSSTDPRDDNPFNSDFYEWDDFYGNSLVGEEDTILELDTSSPQINKGDRNISNWSVDFDQDSNNSVVSSNSALVPSPLLNRSDSACTPGPGKPAISDSKDRFLSDSELLSSKSSTKASSERSSLVASALAKHRDSSHLFSFSPVKTARSKNNFYSLMEDYDIQLDSSQEDGSVASLSDDNEDEPSNRRSHSHNPSLSPSSSIPPSPSSAPHQPRLPHQGLSLSPDT